ncbi:hypothetical protein [Parapedobacter sp. 10938]|uniref:hypothetical protein n=1 Tax=Parapedobacter flavus TaxID=3110225 RepID=UPI002DB75CB4|nr:hypothetical protein [Parapedobacter sp. 10938]MEC3880107.1 hypothetical protein [Parapedobacter sp. 10938]
MKPLWKWAIGVAAGILVVIAVASWFVNRMLKPKLAAALVARVAEGTEGRYALTYNRLELSVLAGNAMATGIRLRPRAPHDSTWRPATSYDIQVARLRVSGVGLLRLLVTGNLHISTIAVDTPSIRITTHATVDTAEVDTAGGAWLDRLAENRALAGTRVGRFAIHEGELALVSDRDAGRLHVRQINATLRDIQVDAAALHDTSRLYGAKAAHITAAAVAYTRPDSLYQLRTGALRFETAKRQAVLRDLQYGLTVSKAEFYRHVGRAEDIGDIAVARISLRGIDIGRWVATQTLAASALHIDSGHIAVYKDKTQPNPPENKIGRSPHQQLLRMEQRVAIDSARVGAMDIRFTEVSDQTGEAGTVTFGGTTALIHHLTNDSAELARDPFMLLHARARAMGAGDLSVDFRFDLRDSLGAHTYHAEVGPMDATAFNRMLTPQLRVEVAGGNVRSLRFDMEANDRRTAGTLQLDYDGLKVNFLRENRDGGTSTKKVASFLANRFLLNDSNPDANGVHHTGQVYIERPASFSFFKMIWRSIREGTKQCIGLGDE